MAELNEKSYAKHFGKTLLRDVAELDPELVEALESKVVTNVVEDSFAVEASLLMDSQLDLTEEEINSLYK